MITSICIWQGLVLTSININPYNNLQGGLGEIRIDKDGLFINNLQICTGSGKISYRVNSRDLIEIEINARHEEQKEIEKSKEIKEDIPF